jgi:hypothetical protein
VCPVQVGDDVGWHGPVLLAQQAGFHDVPDHQCGEDGCGSAGLHSRNTDSMVDDEARDRAIYDALKAADEVAAALQAHLIEEHGADLEREAAEGPATNSLWLLRQARLRLGHGLRAIEADNIAESDEISLRNQ